jgi:Rha family phage regulatory protein
MTVIIPHITPLTRDVDGKPRASSLDVARVFGKRHDHVLRDIDALVSQMGDQPNFGEISYVDGMNRTQRAIAMDRDGFTLLAMGFTGAEALKWKLAYIAAFNVMEAELSARVLTPAEQNLANAQLAVEFERRQIALEQAQAISNATSERALELATIAEAKSQATAMACQDYSIMAYSRLCGIPVDLDTARKLGTKAGHLSRSRGFPIGKARDPRFGSVNTYIESVLQEVFTEGL